MAQRPYNHVTRRGPDPAGILEPFPDLTEAQIAWLERHYPPRCYTAREDLEQHLQYAGVVAFSDMLYAQWADKQRDASTPGVSVELGDDSPLPSDAEDASRQP